LSKSKREFPASFVWGSASSSMQSEGASESSDWRIRERQGLAPESGRGNDKRRRFDEDFLLLAELGITHFRTSLDWSRIEPQRGVYNREAIEEIRIMMDGAKKRGITLWVELHHVVLPAWFAKIGGFMDDTAIVYWHRFVELVAKELGKLADFWIPVHQPAGYAAATNLLGLFPPARKRLDKYQEMLIRMHRAHGDAHRILKAYLPSTARVGMSMLVIPVYPADPGNHSDEISAEFIDSFINLPGLDALREGTMSIPGKGAVEVPSCKDAADFIAADYFYRFIVGEGAAPGDNFLKELANLEGMPGIKSAEEGEEMTQDGVGAFPEGVYDAIKMVSGAKLPIYTTCGIATSDEDMRTAYIKRSMQSVHQTVEQGFEVKGCFYWCDVDCYEWNMGYNAHFGLFGFGKDFERIKRPAADLLSQVARNHSLPE